ncbi:MAG: zinc-binding alcohol dehydrogenase [Planctomycetaceae bacterium]|nr:zinc-binding alcohol dehydrogenase [Planctomycetaceae bacterium]
MTPHAIVAVDAKKVEYREIEIGPMKPWDVKVELEASAVSVGTESYIISTMNKDRPGVIPGYAPIGRIVEASKEAAAAGWEIGQRISYFAPQAAIGLGQGCGGHQGTALVNVDPASRDLLGSDCYVVKVPENLTSQRAAFGGISSVSCQGVSLSHPAVNEKVLVIGAGMIGQFAAFHYRLRGCEVAIADVHQVRLDCAKKAGIDHAINVTGIDMAKAVREIFPGGVDIVADSTGNYAAIENSVGALRWRGRYVFLAWCKGANFNLPCFHNRVHEAFFPWTLEGRRVEATWRLMASGAMNIDPLITHRFKVADAPKAYEMIYAHPEQYTGIAIDWT